MLYIVGTPIGNLDDISLRQAKILVASDYILAEDTRSAKILLDAINKRFTLQVTSIPKIISYYKEKEFEKLAYIIDLLKEGKTVSLISESGMPLISDPGYLLVKTVIKEKLSLTVIPGPSAITTAMVLSGSMKKEFMFLGFLPKKSSELLKLFSRFKSLEELFQEMVFVAYESSQRIKETLKLLSETLPESKICICREMTKKFEEVIRGKPIDLIERNFKGELTLIISFGT